LLSLFPRLAKHYSELDVSKLHDNAMAILVEYCALYAELAPAQLQAHYAPLLGLCRRCLEETPKDRNSEMCLQIIQLLLAHAGTPANLRLLHDIVAPLFQLWSTSCDPQAPSSSLPYPLHSLLQVCCTWRAHHGQEFRQQVGASGAHVAALMVACCKFVRPVVMQVGVLSTALSLAEDNDMGTAFWSELLQRCGDLIATAEKNGSSAHIARALSSSKQALSTKLPIPARSSCELQCSVLPAGLRRLAQPDGKFDEVAIVSWFFETCVQGLRLLGTRGAINLQPVLAAAPGQVQNALRSAGL